MRKLHPVLVLLLSPLILVAFGGVALGLSLIVHLTVARHVPVVELCFAAVLLLVLGMSITYRFNRPPRGRVRQWEIEERRRRR